MREQLREGKQQIRQLEEKLASQQENLDRTRQQVEQSQQRQTFNRDYALSDKDAEIERLQGQLDARAALSANELKQKEAEVRTLQLRLEQAEEQTNRLLLQQPSQQPRGGVDPNVSFTDTVTDRTFQHPNAV